MHRAGCIRLRYGIESGDENILKLMNKKIDLKQAKEVFRMTNDEGIETFAYFMIGYAHETEATIKKTIRFSLELDPNLVMFTVVTPLPQTPLYDLAKNEGFLTSDYWREFTVGKRTDQRIPYFVPDAERWTKKAYTKFYFRPKYIFGQLRKIRSWDAFKKSLQAFRGIYSFQMKGRA